MNKVLEIEKLSFAYDNHPVLEQLDLEVYQNEFVAIIGENGAGKSTLLNIILANLQANAGKVKLFGDLIEENNHYTDIAYISQNSVLAYKDFPTTVEELINVHLRFLKLNSAVKEHLTAVGLETHAHNKLSELSGGQLQRVALAIALIKQAKLIILDEPTSGIDKRFSMELFQTLGKLSRSGHSILMVTHNLSEVITWVDKVLRLKAGKCTLLSERQVQSELAYAANH